jgi:single-strand DNA-binding protein
VVIFNDKIAEIAEKYLRKGAKVFLEGSLQTRKWTDQSGQERYTTEIVLQRYRGEMIMLDARSGGGDNVMSEGGDEAAYQPAPAAQARGSGGRPPAGDLDDDIPF